MCLFIFGIKNKYFHKLLNKALSTLIALSFLAIKRVALL